jgi:hypothetical protein
LIDEAFRDSDPFRFIDEESEEELKTVDKGNKKKTAEDKEKDEQEKERKKLEKEKSKREKDLQKTAEKELKQKEREDSKKRKAEEKEVNKKKKQEEKKQNKYVASLVHLSSFAFLQKKDKRGMPGRSECEVGY